MPASSNSSTNNPAVLRAGIASFCVLASYYLVRPIRDEISSEYPDDVANMWTWTAILSLVIMPLYTAVASKSSSRHLAPRVYLSVAAILTTFAAIFYFDLASNAAVLNQSFYVISSLYALFVVSVLWSTLTGTFSSSQSKKQAGRVFSAGTLGGLLGSATVSFSPETLAVEIFLIGAVILIMPAAWALKSLAALQPAAEAETHSNEAESAEPGMATAATKPKVAKPISERLETGWKRLLKSRYLQGIGLYLLLFVCGSGFLYFMQKDILHQYSDRGERRKILGSMDLGVQILTVATQFFMTSQVIRRWGMPVTLTIVPVLTVVGFGALAAAQTFWVLAALVVLRRATNFALAKPAREILYTVVSPQERYLTKPLLDVGIYRFGDLATAWMYEGIKALTSFGVAGMALVAIPFAGASIPVARWLGRRQEELATAEETVVEAETTTPR
ncbi:MAG: hypothetical protein H8E15_06700 [Planctomycetes bacterium]|nr:hypothetical protein [Planctomycetota bacterium]